MRIIKHLLKPGPLYIFPLIILIHFFIIKKFETCNPNIIKIESVAYQIIGGVIVIYNICFLQIRKLSDFKIKIELFA